MPGGWTTWILASAVMLALYDLAKKASVNANAVIPTLLFSTIAGSGAFLVALAFAGRLGASASAVTSEIAALAAVKTTIVGTSWVFTFRALRTLPISIATPIRASAPALVFVAALFLYGEVPSALQGVGMACIFAGYFLFSWAGRHEGIDFFRSRAVWCAVAGMCCSAASSLWDKYVFQVRGANVEAVQLLFQVGLVLFYALALSARNFLGLRADRFEWRWTIPLVGVLLAGADWLLFKGISGPGVPISVASLLRRFSVVLTFFLGAKFFHETNLARKTLALAAILLGVLLICL